MTNHDKGEGMGLEPPPPTLVPPLLADDLRRLGLWNPQTMREMPRLTDTKALRAHLNPNPPERTE